MNTEIDTGVSCSSHVDETSVDNMLPNTFEHPTTNDEELYNPNEEVQQIDFIDNDDLNTIDNADINDLNRITPSPRVTKDGDEVVDEYDDLNSVNAEDGEEEKDDNDDDDDDEESISLMDIMSGRYYRSDEVFNIRAEGTVETPDLPEEEYDQVMALDTGNGSLIANQKYYLISAVWWRKWKEFSNCNGVAFDRPDAIDNSTLLCEFIPDSSPSSTSLTSWKLKRFISERVDYIPICENAWNLLYGWYGGGPIIEKYTFEEGDRYAKLDLFGIDMNVIRGDTDEAMKVNCRKNITIGNFLKALANQWGLDYKVPNTNTNQPCMRLWDYYNKSRYALLSNNAMIMNDANITENQDMMIEFRQEDGTWKWSEIEKSNHYDPYSSTNYYNSSSSYTSSSLRSNNYLDQNVVVSSCSPLGKGLVGLSNLGNTCFMNSIIQCLSASQPLREVFSSKAYSEDLNLNNPLGHDGKVAEGFAGLMEVMYKSPEEGGGSAVAPRHFKRMIGDIAPQFQGFDQHDSQELLNFLLDGLHEDLNRVLVKESTAPVESGDRSDEEVAAEALQVYKKRNDSVIADLCSGQFKSTVVCPDCGLKSRTFDAYFSVSIPLVKESALEMNLSVKLVTLSGHRSVHNISVPRVGPVGCLKALIAQAYSQSQEHDVSEEEKKSKKVILPINLVVVEIHLQSFYKMFEDLDPIEDISKGDEIVCYEVADRRAFWASTSWGTLPDSSEWFSSQESSPNSPQSWTADFDNNLNNHQTEGTTVEVEMMTTSDEDGSLLMEVTPPPAPLSRELSPWKHGDVWLGSFKPGKVRKRKSSINLLDDYDAYFDSDPNDDDENNFNFIEDTTAAMPCKIEVISEQPIHHHNKKKDHNNDDDEKSSLFYTSLLKSLELEASKQGVSFESLKEEMNLVSSLAVFTYEGMNKRQCSVLLGLSYDEISHIACMFTIGNGHWISKGDILEKKEEASTSSLSHNKMASNPPKLNFKFNLSQPLSNHDPSTTSTTPSLDGNNDDVNCFLWSSSPTQGSTDSIAVIQKLNIQSSNSSSETPHMVKKEGDYVIVSQLDKGVAKEEDHTDEESQEDGELMDSSEEDSAEDDDINNPNYRDVVVVKIVHKLPPLHGYGISRKIGIPLLLTLPSNFTEAQVYEAIVKEATIQGADTELPFELRRANRSFEDNPRYESAGSRVGELVGVGKSKKSRFWKPKKFQNISSSYSSYTSSHFYSNNNYSSSSSKNSFNDGHHVNLCMNWSSNCSEGDVFKKNHGSNGGGGGGGGGVGNGGGGGDKENVMSLGDCLDLFAVTEKLSQEDSWYCPKCKEFKEATKKMDLWTTPPILCIHLKRFSIDSSSFWADKLETPVSFPIDEKLDMSKYSLKPNESYSNYMLYAVSNHFGDTGGGHYTANVRHFEDGLWYDCDDSSVSPIRKSSFDGKTQLDYGAAYVLFYIREDYIPDSWRKDE